MFQETNSPIAILMIHVLTNVKKVTINIYVHNFISTIILLKKVKTIWMYPPGCDFVFVPSFLTLKWTNCNSKRNKSRNSRLQTHTSTGRAIILFINDKFFFRRDYVFMCQYNTICVPAQYYSCANTILFVCQHNTICVPVQYYLCTSTILFVCQHNTIFI